MGDEFEFDDDIFDGVDKCNFDDDIFDGVDEAHLAELERPAKRQKTAAPAPQQPHSHLALAERILKDKFGYESFRHEQAGAIQAILAGDNALVVFPTGAGKSLCYQVFTALLLFDLARTLSALVFTSKL